MGTILFWGGGGPVCNLDAEWFAVVLWRPTPPSLTHHHADNCNCNRMQATTEFASTTHPPPPPITESPLGILRLRREGRRLDILPLLFSTTRPRATPACTATVHAAARTPLFITCREVSLQVWLFSRCFETTYFRSVFHPEYLKVEPDQTAEEALSEMYVEAEKLISMGPRMLQEDMAEVM